MAQIHEQLASSYCANNEQHVTLGSASAGNDADLYLDDALLLKEFDTRETFSDVPAPVPPQPEDLATQSMSSLSAETEEDLGGAPPKKRRKKDETVGTKLVEKEVHSSLFKQGNAVVAEGATIYSDATPLAESTKLSYAGTFTVYLNDENKICRYEFVYTTD